MATMTFLATFDGNLGYRDTSGTGTLTNDGAQSYATSYWAGHQGLITPETVYLPSVANAANPIQGSLVIRFKAPATFGSNYVIATLGSYPTSPHMYLKTMATTGLWTAEGSTGSNFSLTVAAPVNGANTFGYLQWTATGIGTALGTNALTTFGRAATWFPSAGPLIVGALTTGGTNPYPAGRIDGLAIFDGPLTDAQRSYLAGLTTPWTWGMALSAPIPGYIDVLPSPGANTGAPVLTLP